MPFAGTDVAGTHQAQVRFVAVGDSFTEGVGDDRPDGSQRGWADRVAEGLADQAGIDQVWYANLAIRGRRLPEIINEQVPVALALDPPPTLLALNGGGNDMLRPGMDVARLFELTAGAVHRCLTAGVHVLLLAGADASTGLPLSRLISRRGGELTDRVAPLRKLDGVTFVDAYHDLEIRKSRYWSSDRLHLNENGHQRVADLVLAALHGDEREISVVTTPEDRRSLRAEARYYREHVAPWVGRRLTGRSSGDGRSAKYPTWQQPPRQ